MFMVLALWYLYSAVGCLFAVLGVGFDSCHFDWCDLWLACWFGFVVNSVGRFHGCVYFNLRCGLLI